MQRWRQRFRTCMEFQFLRLQVMKLWNWDMLHVLKCFSMFFLLCSKHAARPNRNWIIAHGQQVSCCLCSFEQNRWIQQNSGWSDLGWMGHRTQRWGWIGIRCVWCSHPKLLGGMMEWSGGMLKKYAVAMDFWGLQKLIWSLAPLSSWATLPR